MHLSTVTIRSQCIAETLPVAVSLPAVYWPGPITRPVSSLDFSHRRRVSRGVKWVTLERRGGPIWPPHGAHRGT